MKTIKQTIRQLIQNTLRNQYPGLKEISFEIDCPKNEKFGDYYTNVAMIIAKQINENPLDVAEKIVKLINNLPITLKIITMIKIERPGFINFYLSNSYLENQINQILLKKNKYCVTHDGKNKKIQIEFISANPTGPLTVGNARGGYIGDVLGNVFKMCSFRVTKEYLINDAGMQIENLGHSVLKDEKSIYHGGYIDKLNLKIKETDPYKVGQKAAQIILNDYIKKTVEEKMKIKFDVWFSEQKNIRSKNKIQQIFNWLKEKQLVYEKDKAWWFKSSQYNDDKDRVMIKSDNSPTYLATDFAYHNNKFKRGFDKVINIWGADHHGDVNRLMAAVEVLGHKNQLDIILTQFVRLIKDGKEVRMSKRAGNLVLIDDLINEVGSDATRFYFLKYSADSHIDFDLNLANEKSEKNPVYYVQYAYARICSILRQKEILKTPKKIKIELTNQQEISLAKELIKLPDLLIQIKNNYQVQNLSIYAVSLADKFHQFYTTSRVIDNHQANLTRVKIIQATKIILKTLFDILNVSSPEKM